MQKIIIMETKELLKKIRSVKLCMMAHPDNEKCSEFADRICDLEDIEKAFSTPDIIEQNKQLFCHNCIYHEGITFHDKMYCRDCRQKNRFAEKQFPNI